jgi:hypothetical protein
MNFSIMAPIYRMMQSDPRVEFFLTSSEQHAQEVYRDICNVPPEYPRREPGDSSSPAYSDICNSLPEYPRREPGDSSSPAYSDICNSRPEYPRREAGGVYIPKYLRLIGWVEIDPPRG